MGKSGMNQSDLFPAFLFRMHNYDFFFFFFFFFFSVSGTPGHNAGSPIYLHLFTFIYIGSPSIITNE